MALEREAFHKNFDMTRPVGKGMIPSGNHMTLMNSRDRNAAPLKRLKQGLALLSVLLLVLLGSAAGPATVFAAEAKSTVPTDRPVSYEAFGAVGDCVADDLPAIVEAHAFANRRLARLLQVPEGTPLLRRDRTVLDTGERPMEYAVVRYRCDRFRLTLSLRQES